MDFISFICGTAFAAACFTSAAAGYMFLKWRAAAGLTVKSAGGGDGNPPGGREKSPGEQFEALLKWNPLSAEIRQGDEL